jgi:hypothetical protein
VPVGNASAYVTEHFRVLWGDGFDADDPHWQDPNDTGVPTWVETIGEALESAYDVQTGLGFPGPYGVDTYFIDAYVGNTGVVADGQVITIGSSYYAYTEIDGDYAVAFFVFNDDFSRHTNDELGVLRATAAHELFHAVQRAMGYPWDDEVLIPNARWNREGWWLEASATWLEEITEPEVNDYVGYVQSFLSFPQLSLDSLDGLREYGAAIFAGYLWQLHGGAGLIRTVYENAYSKQLEGAMRGAIAAQGGGELEDVVARFWARAANPGADVWPDAARFGRPPWLASSWSLPVTAYPTGTAGPQRFGANLIRVPAADLPAPVGMDWSDPAASWRIAVADGSASGAEVVSPVAGVAGEVNGSGVGTWAYLAIVNVTASNGAQTFVVEVGDDGLINDGVQWREGDGSGGPAPTSGGGGGGCFLGSLGCRTTR